MQHGASSSLCESLSNKSTSVVSFGSASTFGVGRARSPTGSSVDFGARHLNDWLPTTDFTLDELAKLAGCGGGSNRSGLIEKLLRPRRLHGLARSGIQLLNYLLWSTGRREQRVPSCCNIPWQGSFSHRRNVSESRNAILRSHRQRDEVTRLHDGDAGRKTQKDDRDMTRNNVIKRGPFATISHTAHLQLRHRFEQLSAEMLC